MTVLVDPAVWPWRGRRWAHLVSDESYEELHVFAARLGLERRWFQGDHYDIPAEHRERAIELGALPVSSRELIRRLVGSGLRDRRSRPASRPAPVAVFDLDGTLTDPRVGITLGLQHGLRHVGIEVDDLDTLVPYIGPLLEAELQRRAGLTRERALQALEAYREYYRAQGMFENQVHEGIRPMLEGLAAAGWRLAVATSKPTPFAQPILEQFDLADLFEVVAGATLDGTRQLKRDVIAHTLELLGRQPGADVVMVGDREHDVLGAHAVGIGAVGVTWGYGSEEELVAAGADVVVASASALPAALESLRSSSGRPLAAPLG